MKISSYDRQIARESKDLDTLVDRICGYGYYDIKGTPREVIKYYLKLGIEYNRYRIQELWDWRK